VFSFRERLPFANEEDRMGANSIQGRLGGIVTLHLVLLAAAFEVIVLEGLGQEQGGGMTAVLRKSGTCQFRAAQLQIPMTKD
jgi:hypothetical protein